MKIKLYLVLAVVLGFHFFNALAEDEPSMSGIPQQIADLQAQIDALEDRIASNELDIATNATNIAENAADLAFIHP